MLLRTTVLEQLAFGAEIVIEFGRVFPEGIALDESSAQKIYDAGFDVPKIARQCWAVLKEGPVLMTLRRYGCTYHYVRGDLHSDTGPAIERPNGVEYYQHGQLHRVDGPAHYTQDGGVQQESWYQQGLLHRVDGPAVVTSDGIEEWWARGVRHRLEGPAVTKRLTADSGEEIVSQCYYVHGKRHRVDGPAYTDGHGREEWWLDGKLHRDNGPAVVVCTMSGTVCSHFERQWWTRGILVRTDLA